MACCSASSARSAAASCRSREIPQGDEGRGAGDRGRALLPARRRRLPGRAARRRWRNFDEARSQGASTITMQVARNFYLSTEKTFTRKIYEIAAGAEDREPAHQGPDPRGLHEPDLPGPARLRLRRGGRDLLRQAAARHHAWPRRPCWPACRRRRRPTTRSSTRSARTRAPAVHHRAHARQRLHHRRRSTRRRKDETLRYRDAPPTWPVHAEFVAETARQLVFEQYGEEAYTRGLNVSPDASTRPTRRWPTARCARACWTTSGARSTAARRPTSTCRPTRRRSTTRIAEALADHPDNDDLRAAVVLEAVAARRWSRCCRSARRSPITGDGLQPVASGLSTRPRRTTQIRRGAVVRVVQDAKGDWALTQLPEVEGAFVALDPRTGAIRALVGGFDYGKNKFNHVTQAWRQPGSSFKPFIYSAALEKGFTPATVVNDAPLFFDAGATGSQPWEPKNYDGKFDGPMSLRRGAGASRRTWCRSASCSRIGAALRAGLGHPLRLRRRQAPGLPDDGAGRRLGDAAADGRRLRGVRQRRLPRQPGT